MSAPSMREPDYRQQEEAEQERYGLSWRCAIRLNYALLDGYLTPEEMEHILQEMGILTEWRKHNANRKG